jgi:hypothetical protein
MAPVTAISAGDIAKAMMMTVVTAALMASA